MNSYEEPPDPRTARQQLIHYLEARASGETINGELQLYGLRVVEDLREKIPSLKEHADYARALEELSVTCYRGISGSQEAHLVLDALTTELLFEMPVERAGQLKKGMDLVSKAIDH